MSYFHFGYPNKYLGELTFKRPKKKTVGFALLQVIFTMANPGTLLKNVNMVNYNPRWPQTILVVAVLVSTFVVTLCLLIIHIPALILMQELPKSWSDGFVTA